jgi:acetoin utilization protein AcuC
MRHQAVYIDHQDELKYKFNDEHPFNQKRIVMTADLLKRIGALHHADIFEPRKAELYELLMVHSENYVDIVQELSHTSPTLPWIEAAGTYGLDSQDTPYFPGMHEVTSMVAGGSITAAELVMSGQKLHALHLGGGLHHALHNKGAGFCVYNDASIAIAYIQKHYQAKVLYIDTDVHHGDGVQWSYYTDPTVCTYSIHETGKYLFPGTGFANERGQDDGFGYCYNIPVEPYTEDESWMECFEEGLERIVKQFRPDIIVSQHGCDAHAYDPLSHIHCSMDIYRRMPALIHQAAHSYCDGRWVALGGGGYDIWRVVPRAWSLLWLEMTDHPLLLELDRNPLHPLPPDWVQQWQTESPHTLPRFWLDDMSSWTAIPRRHEITENNRRTTELALQYLPKNK